MVCVRAESGVCVCVACAGCVRCVVLLAVCCVAVAAIARCLQGVLVSPLVLAAGEWLRTSAMLEERNAQGEAAKGVCSAACGARASACAGSVCESVCVA